MRPAGDHFAIRATSCTLDATRSVQTSGNASGVSLTMGSKRWSSFVRTRRLISSVARGLDGSSTAIPCELLLIVSRERAHHVIRA
jgi:hypothetical protein